MSQRAFQTSVFVSAFLLFSIQPLLTKHLIPFFGGSHSVWTIILFFFTTTLVVGYVWGALLIQRSLTFVQRAHTLLIACTVVGMGVTWLLHGGMLLPTVDVGPHPVFSLLLALVSFALLPTLVLASNSVIVQYLFTNSFQEEPYPLYAISNFGSLAGLAVFPFVLEPITATTTQALWWTAAFIIFLYGTLYLLWYTHADTVVEQAKETNARQLMRWQVFLLGALPAFLLASLTEELNRGISGFPLLWVLPLMAYLLSFMVTFTKQSGARAPHTQPFVLLLLALPMVLFFYYAQEGSLFHFLIYVLCASVGLFAVCVFFHGTAYAMRPHTKNLGSFYLYLTIGGAFGIGSFGIVLPMVYNGTGEYLIATAVCLLIMLSAGASDLARYVQTTNATRVVRMVIACALIATPSVYIAKKTIGSVQIRNFYDVLTVREQYKTVNTERVRTRMLVSGAILHGLQVLDPHWEHHPLTYYASSSGVGKVFRAFADANIEPRVAIIGLGVGSLSAYCQQSAQIDYIEINPAVEYIARTYFTYLNLCPEKTHVTIADGRQFFKRRDAKTEEPYDLIIIDAFTDDAIPVHLLTREALTEAYLPHLTPTGIIAFHTSNRFLNLTPPIAHAGTHHRMRVYQVKDTPPADATVINNSTWVVLAHIDNPYIPDTFHEYLYTGPRIIWTDEKNSLLSVLSLTGSK